MASLLEKQRLGVTVEVAETKLEKSEEERSAGIAQAEPQGASLQKLMDKLDSLAHERGTSRSKTRPLRPPNGLTLT